MSEAKDTKYSNPRKELVITDWPSGSHKTLATFTVESVKGKERAVRVTVNPKTGRPNAPKKLTYAKKVRFVDGDDGKLYVLELSEYGSITVMKGTMDYTHEHLMSGNNPRYAELFFLLTGFEG